MKAFKGGDAMEEKNLVEMAIKGDKDSFCRLYELYRNKLYRYAFYRLGNQHDAEDAVSSCVLSAYQQISALRNAKAFSSWIFRILSASCNAVIKNQIERRNTDDIENCENSLITNMDGVVEKTEIQEALNILNDSEKDIVLLSVVAGFSSKEIARAMDMASGTVRSKLSRSLKKMRNFLEDNYESKS